MLPSENYPESSGSFALSVGDSEFKMFSFCHLHPTPSQETHYFRLQIKSQIFLNEWKQSILSDYNAVELETSQHDYHKILTYLELKECTSK